MLSTQDKDELQEHLLRINFCNKEQVIKLASGVDLTDLELGEKEVLLVQAPSTISNSYFISCSELHSLVAIGFISKKQKLKEKETSSAKLFKGENHIFLTAWSKTVTITFWLFVMALLLLVVQK